MNNNYFVNTPEFKITITRRSQLMEKNVPMQIVINGYKAGDLKNGETETFHVAGNQAQVQAFLAMNKTRSLIVSNASDEVNNFIVESNMNDLVFIIGTSLVVIATIFTFMTYNLWYALIAAPPALYHLYIRFVRKDKYLVIREVKTSTSDPVKEVL